MIIIVIRLIMFTFVVFRNKLLRLIDYPKIIHLKSERAITNSHSIKKN